jgi:hypothetical protein
VVGAAESGGTNRSTEPREWILSCEGFRVDGPAGPIGHVVGPLYDHSVRWDRPAALAVRTANTVVAVPLAMIEAVEPDGRRILVSRAADRFPPVA